MDLQDRVETILEKQRKKSRRSETWVNNKRIGIMELSPINTIESQDFHNAWVEAIKFVLRKDHEIFFGDKKEPKLAMDSCQKIILTENAIKQIENKEIPPKYSFKMVEQYCKEFTREYLAKYQMKSEKEKFEYLYFERLAEYDRKEVEYNEHTGIYEIEYIDQLTQMRKDLEEQIKTNIYSNRSQAITWIPSVDMGSVSPPCLQRLWIRYAGEYTVDVHFSWRSRDLFGAWQSNVIALADMLNREVVNPNNCKIKRIVDDNDSLHIYQRDWEDARKVEYLPVNPMLMGR
jgi:thymidylate synthase